MVAMTGTASWLVTLALASSSVALQTPVPETTDGAAIATNRLVVGILSYTEWPTRRDPVRLCMTGVSHRAQRIGTEPLTDGRRVSVMRLAPSAVSAAQCDAIFMGQIAAPDRAQLINRLGNAAIVTITDADPACEYGAMFCLRTTPEGMTFDLNIGSVARSRVRIDPRVLALSRRAGRTP